MRPTLLLGLILAGMLLPFVQKPLYIDDAAHLAMARDLPNHPLRPYDQSREADGGWERFGWKPGQPPNEANPPVYHYFTAFWGSLVGWRLPALHLVFGLLAWASACSLHALAARLGAPPLAAVLLCVFSPVFWLTSTSLLIDAVLLPCGLGGLALGLGAARPGSARLLAGAALVGLAGLVKYTGLAFVPLLALGWLLLDGRRAALRRLPLLLIPAGLFLGWCLWTKAAYGEPHVTAITRASWGSMMNPYLAVVFLSFLSGAAVVPLALAPLSFPGAAGAAAAAALASALYALFASDVGGFPSSQAALLAVFVAASLGFLALLARRRRSLRAPEDLFLLAWLALGLAASLARGSGGWLAGRYFLIALPPMALLAAKMLPARALRLAVAVTGIAGLLLACADYQAARLNVRLAERLRGAPPGRYPSYSLTGLGVQLRPLGWRPAEAASELGPGETVLHLTRTLPRQFQPVPADAEALHVVELNGLLPLRVFDLPSGAGFYGSIFGPLPWSLTAAPLERALILKAQQGGQAPKLRF